MPLNVEFQGHDLYDREYMYRNIFPKEFQEEKEQKVYSTFLNSISHKQAPVSTMRNQILESIILGENSTSSIDMIAMPFIFNDNKVIANKHGEFIKPYNGEFMIELRPKYDVILPHKMPEEAECYKRNHEYGIFKYTIPATHGYEDPVDVIVNLFYKPLQSANPVNQEKNNQDTKISAPQELTNIPIHHQLN